MRSKHGMAQHPSPGNPLNADFHPLPQGERGTNIQPFENFMSPSFSLVTTWTPATDSEPLGYGIELTNTGDTPVRDFTLGFSGPARIDPQATLENGRLLKRLSNHTLIAPPEGFVLEPGQTWKSTARGLSYGLRHWSDGANSGYVALSDGTIVTLPTAPTQAKGHNSPLLKGAAKFPVPSKAPVPVSIIP